MENKLSLFKFLTLTFTNVIFLFIGLSLGTGIFGYGIFFIATEKYTFGILMCVCSSLWLIGYRWRLLQDFEAYKQSIDNKNQDNEIIRH
jgi:hypothetical protein